MKGDSNNSEQCLFRICERKKFIKMPNCQRFQQKLWSLVNSCQSGSVRWNKSGDAIVFNFTLFKKEFLDNSNTFCKSNKLASFVRQLNLYGFKKVTGSRKHRKGDHHEFKHPWFARDKEDWLQNVIRNSVFPIRTKKRTARKPKAHKKKSKINEDDNEPRQVKRRGRPKKSEQLNKLLQIDHSYEKKDTCYFEKKENGPWLIPSFRKTSSSRKSDKEKCFQDWKCVQFNQGKNEEHLNIQSTQLKFSEQAKQMENVPNQCRQKENKFMPMQEGKQASTKCHYTSLIPAYTARQHTLPTRVFQSLENIAPTGSEISATATPNQPAIQSKWDGFKSGFEAKDTNGNLKLKQHNENKTLVQQMPLPSVCSEKVYCAMEATKDENQHVMLRIKDPYMSDNKKTLDKTNNHSSKLTLLNGQIGKESFSKGRMEYVNNALSRNGRNIASNVTECARVSQNWKTVDVSQACYSVHGTECYVTKEFLDIREAYFRLYPERRPALDGPDLRIYRKL